MNEIVTSSLIGKPLLDRFMIPFEEDKAVYVKNAASEDYTMLRQTLAASVLNVMKTTLTTVRKHLELRNR